MIYLASPYSHPDDRVQEERYLQTMHAASLLMKRGLIIFSPIVHCRPMAIRFNLPHHAAFWQNYNFGMLAKADELKILCLDGWEESKGIAGEIREATRLGILISKLSYLELIGAPGELDAMLEELFYD